MILFSFKKQSCVQSTSIDTCEKDGYALPMLKLMITAVTATYLYLKNEFIICCITFATVSLLAQSMDNLMHFILQLQ